MQSTMNFVLVSGIFSVLVSFVLSENAATDVGLPEDVVSCLKDSNMTYEEASKMEFFLPNKTIPHNAKCFAACLLSTDYNVSVSSEGIIEKEGLLLDAVMQDSEFDHKNATDVVDVCKNIITVNDDACENLYNYATCVNQKYFERKGFSNFTGHLVLEEDIYLENGTSPSTEGVLNTAVPSAVVPSNS